MTHIDDIDKIIKKAALDGALTEGAVKQFHEILAENRELKEENEHRWKELIKKDADIDRFSKDLALANTLIKEAARLELAMLEREKFITTLEMTAKYEIKRVEDHKEMVKLIFRNSILRKEVMTPIDGSKGTDQYNAPLPGGYATKDTVEETES